jgi:hypothetical protein
MADYSAGHRRNKTREKERRVIDSGETDAGPQPAPAAAGYLTVQAVSSAGRMAAVVRGVRPEVE